MATVPGTAFHRFVASHSTNPTSAQPNVVSQPLHQVMPSLYLNGAQSQTQVSSQQGSQGSSWRGTSSSLSMMQNRFSSTPTGASTPTRGQTNGNYAGMMPGFPATHTLPVANRGAFMQNFQQHQLQIQLQKLHAQRSGLDCQTAEHWGTLKGHKISNGYAHLNAQAGAESLQPTRDPLKFHLQHGAPNERWTVELLGMLKQILHSRDQYITQLRNTLNDQQREQAQVEVLLQQIKDSSGTVTPAWSGKSSSVDIPFYWQIASEYASEFAIIGQHKDTVQKTGDFENQGWVIPVSGSLRMVRGGLYRWSMLVGGKCPHRPQMQFGVHGLNHETPWRLVTTSRCSRSRDNDPWQDRPDGDRLIDVGDVIHMIVDMRGINDDETFTEFGKFSFSVNDEPFEKVFDDLPLENTLMPVVSMGGDGSSVTILRI